MYLFIHPFIRSFISLLIFSAVKRLIVINLIQNKSFCLHNICVYCVYLLCIYKYTHIENIYVYTFIYSYFYILYIIYK